MTDIEKIKIDLLRDALKDVIDTVRALDRKIVFLASYNAVFLGIIFSFFFKYNNIVEQVNYSQYFYPLLGILTLIWVFNFIRVMIGISPRSNPVEVFKSEEDKLFSNNIFFVSTDAKENSLVLDDMLINYSEIDNYEGLQKLLYRESVIY